MRSGLWYILAVQCAYGAHKIHAIICRCGCMQLSTMMLLNAPATVRSAQPRRTI